MNQMATTTHHNDAVIRVLVMATVMATVIVLICWKNIDHWYYNIHTVSMKGLWQQLVVDSVSRKSIERLLF